MVSYAGPAVNLGLTLLAYAILPVAASSAIASSALKVFAQMNLSLFLFNMFPLWPLDGGRALHATVDEFGGEYAKIIALSISFSAIVCAGSRGLIGSKAIMCALAFLILCNIPASDTHPIKNKTQSSRLSCRLEDRGNISLFLKVSGGRQLNHGAILTDLVRSEQIGHISGS